MRNEDSFFKVNSKNYHIFIVFQSLHYFPILIEVTAVVDSCKILFDNTGEFYIYIYCTSSLDIRHERYDKELQRCGQLSYIITVDLHLSSSRLENINGTVIYNHLPNMQLDLVGCVVDIQININVACMKIRLCVYKNYL